MSLGSSASTGDMGKALLNSGLPNDRMSSAFSVNSTVGLTVVEINRVYQASQMVLCSAVMLLKSPKCAIR